MIPAGIAIAMLVLSFVYVAGIASCRGKYLAVALAYSSLCLLCIASFLLISIGHAAAGIAVGIISLMILALEICALSYIATGYKYVDLANEPSWVVVLGCKLIEDKPSKMLYLRLNAALACHHQHPTTNIMVCGGKGADEIISEAKVMSDYLLSKGVPDNLVTLEDKSTSTEENLLNYLAISGSSTLPIMIVTNDFHARRTQAILSKFGFENTAFYPCKTPLPSWINGAYREALCILASKLGLTGHNIRIAGKRL